MSTTRVSRAAVGVVALLLAGVLAGCDDEDPPEPQGPIESSSEPTSPPTSATSEPTPTGPMEPTLCRPRRKRRQAGVEGFVGYYWEVVNYATDDRGRAVCRAVDQPSCMGATAASN